jgi:hypothetical protein
MRYGLGHEIAVGAPKGLEAPSIRQVMVHGIGEYRERGSTWEVFRAKLFERGERVDQCVNILLSRGGWQNCPASCEKSARQRKPECRRGIQQHDTITC